MANPIDPNKKIEIPDSARAIKEAAKKPGGGAGEIGEQEFLQLLVNQLENQDPLNPMDSQQFAVQLAQFSSLEQLISINGKLDGGAGGAGGGAATMAAFLGHEVVVDAEQVNIAGGAGPNIMLQGVPAGAQSARIDFLNEQGQVVGSGSVDAPKAGNHVVALSGLTIPDGAYGIQAKVVDGTGQFRDVSAKITGTVEGFILEPEPALLVNGEEVALASVTEVYAGK